MRATRTSRTIQRIAYDRGVRSLGLLWLIAACSPSGLTLEVVISDPNIKKVELMAGDQCHPDCPRGTIPPGMSAVPLQDAFVVLDPVPFTVTDNDLSDGLATFHIDAPADTYLPILALIGYDEKGEVHWSWSRHWAQIPGDGERWRIELDTTTRIAPTTTRLPPGTERHLMWPDPGGHTSCLLLEHWSDKPLPVYELIAPDSDHDCDGVSPANECAPWIPNAMGTQPTIADANCLVPAPIDELNMQYACQLGGPLCNETPVMPGDSCVPVDEAYCAPEILCGCRADPDPEACVRAKILNGTTDGSMPYLKCVIRLDTNGDRCDSSQLTIDASALLVTSAAKCTGLSLSDGGTPFDPFDNVLHVGEAKLKLDNFSMPCKTDAFWENGTVTNFDTFGLLGVDIDNGYHLVVPVRVELKPGCDLGGSMCQFYRPSAGTSETMYHCLDAAPMGSACAPDPSGTCGGPMCGNVCCGVGEQCLGGMCACGMGSSCPDGDICASGGPLGDNTCGSICCGQSGPCPLNP